MEDSNENILKEENVSKITKLTVENLGNITYRIDLVKPMNDIDYTIISKDSESNITLFLRFVKENNGDKHLYTKDGLYDFTIKFNDKNEIITFKDENLTSIDNFRLMRENCYDGCMGDAKYNCMADSNGDPSDGVERALNEATWKTIGESVAIVVCGGCCEGLWNCPKRVKSENVIVTPGENLSEILNPGEVLLLS